MKEIINNALRIIADATLVHERVDADEKTRRLSICENCAQFDSENRKCTMCGCFMDVKAGAKTNYNPKAMRNEITHCPNGFWADEEISELYQKGGLPITNNN